MLLRQRMEEYMLMKKQVTNKMVCCLWWRRKTSHSYLSCRESKPFSHEVVLKRKVTDLWNDTSQGHQGDLEWRTGYPVHTYRHGN